MTYTVKVHGQGGASKCLDVLRASTIGLSQRAIRNKLLPPFLSIGCIVFGTEIKEHTWRENFTSFGRHHTCLIDMRKQRSLHDIRKCKQIPQNIIQTSGAAQYTLYFGIFLKNLYTLYQGTEGVVYFCLVGGNRRGERRVSRFFVKSQL